MIGDTIIGGMLLALFGGITLLPWWRKRQRQRDADYAELRNCLVYHYKVHPERFEVIP